MDQKADNFISKVKDILPHIENGEVPIKTAEMLFDETRQAIKKYPNHAKELGRLIPEINKILKLRQQIPDLHWQPIKNGFLAIGHKPGGKISFEGMRLTNISAVVTLLNENEGAAFIGNGLKKQEIDWLWFPFSASAPHTGSKLQEVVALFHKMEEYLNNGGRVYLHCSAGIHRTGMITYAFLRYLGQDKATAFSNLERLRKITAEGATDERLLWGDQFGKND